MEVDSYDVNRQNLSQSSQQIDAKLKQDIFFEAKLEVEHSSTQAVSVAINQSESIVYDAFDQLSDTDKLNKLIIEKLLARIMQKNDKIRLYPDDSFYKPAQLNIPYEDSSYQSSATNVAIQEEYYAKESISFSAKAIFKTPEQEFEIEMNLSYTQEFYASRSYEASYLQDSFKQPIHIDYDGNTDIFKNFGKPHFLFDQANDGNEEKIPLLHPNHHFLRKNENDEHNNNSNQNFDNLFDHLRVWGKNRPEDNYHLLGIGKEDIGAVYLASTSTQMVYSASVSINTSSLNQTSQNNTYAVYNESGKESQKVPTEHEVDLNI